MYSFLCFTKLEEWPARWTLENNGITQLEDLTKYSEKEILKFHGLGKSSLPILKKLLSEKNHDSRLWKTKHKYDIGENIFVLILSA